MVVRSRSAAHAFKRTKIEFSLEEVTSLNSFIRKALAVDPIYKSSGIANAIRKLNFAEARMLGKLFPGDEP